MNTARKLISMSPHLDFFLFRRTIQYTIVQLSEMSPKNLALISTAAKSLQSCLTLRLHRQKPTRLPRPWDSPGKNTRVGCRFLLQCMKMKSESEVAQLCPTLSNRMDCHLPGSSIQGIFQARVLEWGAIAFSYDIRFDSKEMYKKYTASSCAF